MAPADMPHVSFKLHRSVVPICACREGLATQFVELPINVSDAKLWEGVRLRYWQLDTYYLPVVQHDDEDEEPDGADETKGERQDASGQPPGEPVSQAEEQTLSHIQTEHVC